MSTANKFKGINIFSLIFKIEVPIFKSRFFLVVRRVDQLTIPSKRPGKLPLKRVSEVFDCWFESGSMPYAQMHFPFEKRKEFEESFPADFIAEGLDQTRGWFYTLMVVGSCLFAIDPWNLLCEA